MRMRSKSLLWGAEVLQRSLPPSPVSHCMFSVAFHSLVASQGRGNSASHCPQHGPSPDIPARQTGNPLDAGIVKFSCWLRPFIPFTASSVLLLNSKSQVTPELVWLLLLPFVPLEWMQHSRTFLSWYKSSISSTSALSRDGTVGAAGSCGCDPLCHLHLLVHSS